METLIGPAIVAAFISGLVSLVVVQLNFRQERKADRLRREEKIRDFQIALRAEIRSELANLQRFDLAALYGEVEQKYARDPQYSVSVPRISKHVIFDSIAKEIHILPESVIGAVVFYARQRQAVESLADDMRDPTFRSLAKERQLDMYRDYLGMWDVWRDLAAKAERALESGKIQ